jgi:hypothetical protein
MIGGRYAMAFALASALTACNGRGNSLSNGAASAGRGTASLSWSAPDRNTDGSPLTQIAGYYVYYGPSASSMTQTIRLTDPAATSYVLTGLGPGTYYFSIAAYTKTGAEGQRTAPVATTIPR